MWQTIIQAPGTEAWACASGHSRCNCLCVKNTYKSIFVSPPPFHWYNVTTKHNNIAYKPKAASVCMVGCVWRIKQTRGLTCILMDQEVAGCFTCQHTHREIESLMLSLCVECWTGPASLPLKPMLHMVWGGFVTVWMLQLQLGQLWGYVLSHKQHFGGKSPGMLRRKWFKEGIILGSMGPDSARFIPQHTQTHTQIGHTLCSGVPRPVVGHVCSFVR